MYNNVLMCDKCTVSQSVIRRDTIQTFWQQLTVDNTEGSDTEQCNVSWTDPEAAPWPGYHPDQHDHPGGHVDRADTRPGAPGGQEPAGAAPWDLQSNAEQASGAHQPGDQSQHSIDLNQPMRGQGCRQLPWLMLQQSVQWPAYSIFQTLEKWLLAYLWLSLTISLSWSYSLTWDKQCIGWF